METHASATARNIGGHNTSSEVELMETFADAAQRSHTAPKSQHFFGSGINGNGLGEWECLHAVGHNTSSEVELMETPSSIACIVFAAVTTLLRKWN